MRLCRIWAARTTTTFAVGAFSAAICLTGTGVPDPGQVRLDDVSWGPVHTINRHRMDRPAVVTTDSGAAVAVWSAYPSNDLLVAVRRGPQGWTKPTAVVPSGAAAFSIAKSGDSAWAVAQNGKVVRVVQVDRAGRISKPQVVGSSSNAFIADPVIGLAPNGAGAAVWHLTTHSKDAFLAYRTSAGEWEKAERMPVDSAYLLGVAADTTGTVGVVFRSTGEAGGRRGFYYIERHADGSWSTPQIIAGLAVRGTMATNAEGDLVVAYNVGDDQSAKAYVRYRPAGGDFGPPLHLPEKATGYTYTSLAVADDGTAAATYNPNGAGTSPVELIRTDSTGAWSEPEQLALGGGGGIAANAAGDLLISDGKQFVRCPAGGGCGDLELDPDNPGATTVYTLGPEGAINVFWFSGCSGVDCSLDLLQTHRGR